MFYPSIVPCILFLCAKPRSKYNYGTLLNLPESVELTNNMLCFVIVWYPGKSKSQGGKMSLHVQLLILIIVDGTWETLRSFECFLCFLVLLVIFNSIFFYFPSFSSSTYHVFLLQVTLYVMKIGILP